jgi:GT2 family glycosyltransferase
MGKVDILLPVTHSLKETYDCIDSLLMCTPQEQFHLYLLADNSPDQRVQMMVNMYAEKYPNVVSIRTNGSVNNGLKFSENDVLILNHTMLVTDNWLDTMMKIATSDDAIAAVTPMSNCGSLSGLPTANSAINDLFTFGELAAAFQNSKESGYMEAPLVMGVCFYMKRNAINTIGMFDTENFEQAYEAETDWCMRARKSGFKLAVAKGAYVHRIGGSQVGAEQGWKEMLRKQDPQLVLELEKFLKENHFKKIRRNMMRSLPFLQKESGTRLKLKMIKHYVTDK